MSAGDPYYILVGPSNNPRTDYYVYHSKNNKNSTNPYAIIAEPDCPIYGYCYGHEADNAMSKVSIPGFVPARDVTFPDGGKGVITVQGGTSKKRGGPACVTDGVTIFSGGYGALRYAAVYKKVEFDEAYKRSCIKGEVSSSGNWYCAPDWKPGTTVADNYMIDYCKTPEGIKDPACGCLLPDEMYAGNKLLGPIECIDKRCTSSKAYKLPHQANRTCNIVNCVMENININAIDVKNIDLIKLEQQCGITQEMIDKLKEKQKIEENNNKVMGSSLLTLRNGLIAGGIGLIIIGGGIIGYKYMNKNKN